MARYENKLTTTQARTIIDAINRFAEKMENRNDIQKNAENIVNMLENLFPAKFPVVDENAYFAFTLSSCAKVAIKRGDLNILEYIAILASVKKENEETLSDYGAFGDLYEVLVRCAFMRKLSLVKWSTLSVKSIEKTDLISKKYGNVEIGHNGKTLSFGTYFDYMAGDYNAFVYGVFTKEDKEEIYSLCINQKYEKVIDYITSYSVYWSDKYAFQYDMDNLTRGKGITEKSDGIQVVYNSGKHTAFVDAIENGVFQSLYETLKR